MNKRKDDLRPFNTLLGYIGRATSKGMKGRMIVLSDVQGFVARGRYSYYTTEALVRKFTMNILRMFAPHIQLSYIINRSLLGFTNKNGFEKINIS